MAMNGNRPTGIRRLTLLSGIVEAINDRGVKLAGEWHNVSKWAEDVDLSPLVVGEPAAFRVDDGGWIMQPGDPFDPQWTAPPPEQTSADPPRLSAGQLQWTAPPPEQTSADPPRLSAGQLITKAIDLADNVLSRQPSPDHQLSAAGVYALCAIALRKETVS